MAETPSSAEWQKAERDSPSDATPRPARHRANPDQSLKSNRPPGIAQSGPVSSSGATIHVRHFTLYAAFTSTKKRGLRTAFGVRAGRPTARNRAKRQAREEFRLRHHRLPEAINILITNRGTISALTRRSIRQQLVELFDRACRLAAAGRDDKANTR